MDEEATVQENETEATVEETTTEQAEEQESAVEETEETEEESQEQSQEESEESEETTEPLSRRQEKRVEQVEAQAKEYKLNKILDRVQAVKQSQPKKPLDYKDVMNAPDELVGRLDKDRQDYGDQKYNEGLERVKLSEWKTNIRLDLPIVKEQMDKLDTEDARAIDREYLIYSGFDPETNTVRNSDISYADFVSGRIEQAKRLAQSLAVKSQKNITKQAAQTGIRPDGGAVRSKTITSPEDIANIDQADWDKNRDAYLKQLGVKKRSNLY